MRSREWIPSTFHFQSLNLTVKNGNISGAVTGSYDDFDIQTEIKKGESSLPDRKEGGTEETRGKNGVGKACGERKRGCDGVPFPAACHDPAAGVVFL